MDNRRHRLTPDDALIELAVSSPRQNYENVLARVILDDLLELEAGTGVQKSRQERGPRLLGGNGPLGLLRAVTAINGPTPRLDVETHAVQSDRPEMT